MTARRLGRCAAAAVLSGAVFAASTTVGGVAASSVESRILVADGDGVFHAAPDGTDRRTVPIGPVAMAKVSPDGSQVAYIARDTDFTLLGARVANIDGTGVQDLAADVRAVSWHRNGTKLLLSIGNSWDAETSPRLEVVDLTTGEVTPVPGGEGLADAAWSPIDDRIIALDRGSQSFVSEPEPACIGDAPTLQMLAPDGTRTTLATDPSGCDSTGFVEGSSGWSPDGLEFLYSYGGSACSIHLRIGQTSGNFDDRRWAAPGNEGCNEESGVWSPKGDRLLYRVDHYSDWREGGVFTASAVDGSDRVRLTECDRCHQPLDWFIPAADPTTTTTTTSTTTPTTTVPPGPVLPGMAVSQMTVAAGGTLLVTAQGFAPESTVTVVLVLDKGTTTTPTSTTPTTIGQTVGLSSGSAAVMARLNPDDGPPPPPEMLLAEIPVDFAGMMEADVLIPPETPAGRHDLEVRGVAPDGSPLVVSETIEVFAAEVAPVSAPLPSTEQTADDETESETESESESAMDAELAATGSGSRSALMAGLVLVAVGLIAYDLSLLTGSRRLLVATTGDSSHHGRRRGPRT